MASSEVSYELLLARVQRAEAANARSGEAPSQSGGPGGTSGDMEARLSQLEKRFDRVETKLDANTSAVTDLRVGMATLTERVAHLPTKGWAVGIVVTMITIIGALITLAPKLQQVFGVVPK